MCSRACALQQEKPLKWEARTLQVESSPHSSQLEKPLRINKDTMNAAKQPKTRKTYIYAHTVLPIWE